MFIELKTSGKGQHTIILYTKMSISAKPKTGQCPNNPLVTSCNFLAGTNSCFLCITYHRLFLIWAWFWLTNLAKYLWGAL